MTHPTHALTRCAPVWKGSVPGFFAGMGLATVGFFAAPFLKVAARPVGAAAKGVGRKAGSLLWRWRRRTEPEVGGTCSSLAECSPDTM
ncbi:MAG: hypothetical protein HY900_30890 [Deltaproteobacteria bacterium]|nr:hypothetical protein [Deltaproteobacteria bacterium]